MPSPAHGSLSCITANKLASRTWSETELRALILDVVSKTATPKPSQKTSFHSTIEAKDLISLRINDLRQQFGTDPFVPAAFRHALKVLTTMREGDLVVLSDGYPRWDKQVGEAMKTSQFIVSVKHGWYRLLTEQELTGQGALPLEG